MTCTANLKHVTCNELQVSVELHKKDGERLKSNTIHVTTLRNSDPTRGETMGTEEEGKKKGE